MAERRKPKFVALALMHEPSTREDLVTALSKPEDVDAEMERFRVWKTARDGRCPRCNGRGAVGACDGAKAGLEGFLPCGCEICHLCHGRGTTADVIAALEPAAHDDDDKPCQICYCASRFKLAVDCEHFYCADCIKSSLEAMMDTASSRRTARCAARTRRATSTSSSAALASSRPHAHVPPARGVFEKDFQFRFMLQAFKDRGEKFFRCRPTTTAATGCSRLPGEILEVKGAKIVREKKMASHLGRGRLPRVHEIPRFVKPSPRAPRNRPSAMGARAPSQRRAASLGAPGARSRRAARWHDRAGPAVGWRPVCRGPCDSAAASRRDARQGGGGADDDGTDRRGCRRRSKKCSRRAQSCAGLPRAARRRRGRGCQGEGIEMRANLDLEAANENRHATFVAWSDIEVPLPIEQIAQAHECPEDKLSQEEMDDETRKTMEKMGKRCPVCHSFIQKNDGCDWMSCGTTAHGSLKDCIRNGGCGIAFQWNSGTVADDPCGWKDLDGSHTRGRPVTARQRRRYTQVPRMRPIQVRRRVWARAAVPQRQGHVAAPRQEHCCRECRETAARAMASSATPSTRPRS